MHIRTDLRSELAWQASYGMEYFCLARLGGEMRGRNALDSGSDGRMYEKRGKNAFDFSSDGQMGEKRGRNALHLVFRCLYSQHKRILSCVGYLCAEIASFCLVSAVDKWQAPDCLHTFF